MYYKSTLGEKISETFKSTWDIMNQILLFLLTAS